MASHLSLVLIAIACVASSQIFVAGKPSFDDSKIENFWPDKCDKFSGGKSRRSADNSLEKEEICPIWAKWVEQFGGACKVRNLDNLIHQSVNQYI